MLGLSLAQLWPSPQEAAPPVIARGGLGEGSCPLGGEYIITDNDSNNVGCKGVYKLLENLASSCNLSSSACVRMVGDPPYLFVLLPFR